MDLLQLTTPSMVQPPITEPYPYQSVPNPHFTENLLDTPLFVIPSTTLAPLCSRTVENDDCAVSKNTIKFSTYDPAKHCNPNILYRPTPIHPAAASNSVCFISVNNSAGKPDEHSDIPLDLSFSTKNREARRRDSDTFSSTDAAKQESFLPTCDNSNLNWIVSKLSSNRMSYPREFKLMVINYYHKHGQNKYRTCKEFRITKSMLNGWLQKIEKIIQSPPGSLKSGRSGRKPQFPDIEKQLFHLYCGEVELGHKIGNQWIRQTAKNLAQQQCSQQELAGMCRFSERWLSNFKKRYHINLHRKWSSGSSSTSSLETSSSDSSGIETNKQPSPVKSEITGDFETSEMEDMIPIHGSLKSESPDVINEPDAEPSSSDSFIFGQEQANEVLNKPGQLPILTFYERFPWLCKRNNTGTEPGKRGRKVQFPDVEKILFDRYQQKQDKGERVSNRWLQEQARELATKMCPEVLQEVTRSSRCLFSEHWLHNFKKRYDISLKPSTTIGRSFVPDNHNCYE